MQNVMKNWKTSLFGLLAGIGQIGVAATNAQAGGTGWHQSDYLSAGMGIMFALIGAAAKDSTVTGNVP